MLVCFNIAVTQNGFSLSDQYLLFWTVHPKSNVLAHLLTHSPPQTLKSVGGFWIGWFYAFSQRPPCFPAVKKTAQCCLTDNPLMLDVNGEFNSVGNWYENGSGNSPQNPNNKQLTRTAIKLSVCLCSFIVNVIRIFIVNSKVQFCPFISWNIRGNSASLAVSNQLPLAEREKILNDSHTWSVWAH